MKCGMDAIADSCARQDRENELCMMLSLPCERLAQGVQKLMDDLAAAKYKLCGMKREQIELDIQTADVNDRCVCLFKNDFEVNELRTLALGVAEKTGGTCGAFSECGEGEYRFVLADVSGNFDDTAKRFRDTLAAKGGGKAPAFQGTFKGTEEQIRTFFFKNN
jgi:alanyl-tRNA synthetase